jgi:hypothetical protein
MDEEDKFIMDKMFDKIMEHCGDDLAEIEDTIQKYTVLEQTMMIGYLLAKLIENSPIDKQIEIKRLIEEAIIQDG